MNIKSDGNFREFKSDGNNIDILPFWAASPLFRGIWRASEGLREPQRAFEGLLRPRGPRGILGASEGFKEPLRVSMSF